MFFSFSKLGWGHQFHARPEAQICLATALPVTSFMYNPIRYLPHYRQRMERKQNFAKILAQT